MSFSYWYYSTVRRISILYYIYFIIHNTVMLNCRRMCSSRRAVVPVLIWYDSYSILLVAPPLRTAQRCTRGCARCQGPPSCSLSCSRSFSPGDLGVYSMTVRPNRAHCHHQTNWQWFSKPDSQGCCQPAAASVPLRAVLCMHASVTQLLRLRARSGARCIDAE